MAECVDIYWSFRSPYSYLATPDMLALGQRYNVEVNFRPVFPIAVRDPEFFSPENAKRGRYIQLDWVRRAQFLGMPHAWPSPDPIVQDMDTFEIAPDQPLIYRLTKLGIEAQRQGLGVEFASYVSNMIWSGTKDWHLGDHLAQAAAQAGLDLVQMEQAIDGGDHLQEIEGNQQQLEAARHWGVPTYVFRDEPFFGQDRFDLLCWRLDQHDLKK